MRRMIRKMRFYYTSLLAWTLLAPGYGRIQEAQAGPAPADVSASNQEVHVGGQTFHCKVVTIRLKNGRIVPRLVTAKEGVGRTEAFESMIKRAHAVAAVNGSFFDAYNQTGDKDPNMTLIAEGNVIHKGGIGTVFGFGAKGPVMGKLDLPIRGTVTAPGRRPASWYAYWINRTPTTQDNITIFTPARGARTRVSDGICVTVKENLVTRVAPGDAAIPSKGFVIHFRGGEAAHASKFVLGAFVKFEVARKSNTDESVWADVTEGVGAGPRLLTDGQIRLSPTEEGFTEAKILTNAGLRSAIGLTANGNVLLVSVSGATMQNLAEVMRKLGAAQAMNLDGGASAGLYCNGELLTRPGRPLSNALMFVLP
jgi:hypothetical protein